MGFKQWNDYQSFSSTVRNKNRFIHSADVVSFLTNVKDSLSSREIHLRRGKILHRTQFGYVTTGDDDSPWTEGHPPERMIPKSKFAKDGRANPKGIAYFYLSSDIHTSISEMKPPVGQWLSCAQFKTVRPLRIVDCHSNEKDFCLSEVAHIFNPPTTQHDISRAVWYMINEAFSVPVSNSDTNTDYIPTQILAELFNAEGYDGIRHNSSLGKGLNYILFDLGSVEYIKCNTVEIQSIKYRFKKGQAPLNFV